MAAVLLAIEAGVATLTLNRPACGNAINLDLARDFKAAVDEVRAQAARVILLAGAGKHFCLGGDIRSPDLDAAGLQAHVLELTRTLHAALATLLRGEAPVIAAVGGGVAGAGLGLLGVCDLVVASDAAFFLGAFTAVGLTPDSGVSLTLPRLVGARRAAELLLTGRRLDAATALDWGLVNRVTPAVDLAATATALALQLADGPTSAFGATRRLLAAPLAGFEAHLEREAQSIAARRITAEGREGVQAHLERRAPDFRAAADPTML